MELEQVKLQTTWNDAAGSINSNYAKIADAIAQLKANGGGGGGGADIDLTDYATKVWVEANYAPLTSIQGFENRIGGLEGAVPTLNTKVTEVEGKVSTLNELVSTGENNLLDRVNVIEEEYATKTYVDNAIDGIDLSPYLKTDDAEDTYATKDFVNNKLVDYAPLTSVQGFENRIGGLEGAVPKLNDRVTTVESKVSTLNETVSTGKNNLLDRVNTIETDYVTSGNLESAINGIDLSVYLLKADLTKSRIQSTLGISDWALASVKPTYTASEVGALGVNGTAQSALKMTPEYLTDLNSATPWRFFDMNTGFGSTDGNKPNTAWVSGITGTVAGSSNYRWQLAMTTGSRNPYFRQEANGNWNNWSTLAFTSNIPTRLSQLTDDVVAGKYLPLSEFQVAAVPNPSTVYLQSGIYRQNDGPHLAVGTSGWSQFITLHAEGDNWAQMYFSYDGRLHYRTATFGDGDPANIPWTAIITEKNIGNYNAGSATKLKTRCKLWGNDFDGTADVSGNLFSDIWRIIKSSNWNGTFIQSANYDGTSDLGNIYMTAMYGSKLISFNVWANNSKFSDNVTVDGNVGIGNTSPTEKLDVSGNIKASGNINATSITINGVTITASNGSITVNGNVIATGSITQLGSN